MLQNGMNLTMTTNSGLPDILIDRIDIDEDVIEINDGTSDQTKLNLMENKNRNF